MREGYSKPDVTRTRSRCTSLIGAVLSIPPPKGIDGWSLADCLINRPTNLATGFFPSFRVPLTIAQSHKSIVWKSGTVSSPEWITWPYWACQFSSSQEVPGGKHAWNTSTQSCYWRTIFPLIIDLSTLTPFNRKANKIFAKRKIN